MLKRIYSVTPWKNQKAVCQGLKSSTPGVDRVHSTLRRSLARGEGVPIDWLIHVSWLFGVRLDWLKTGEGPIYEDPSTIASLGPVGQALVRHWQTLSPDHQALVLRLALLIPAFAVELEVIAGLLARIPLLRPTASLPEFQAAASPDAEAGAIRPSRPDSHFGTGPQAM